MENDVNVKTPSDQLEASSSQLRDQAYSVRQSAIIGAKEFYECPLAVWKRFLYLFFISASLLAVMLLLVVDESRRQLGGYIGSILHQGDPVEINWLPPPPPPPRIIQTQVITEGETITTVPAQETRDGVLFLDQDPMWIGEQDEKASAPVELPRTEINKNAYALLVNLSDIATQVSQNGFSNLEFLSWRPVKDEAPEFWIDLVAIRQPEGQEVHLIWSVDTESESITALSQAARDLESSQ